MAACGYEFDHFTADKHIARALRPFSELCNKLTYHRLSSFVTLTGMRADDITRAQARALKNKLGPMVAYLNRLGKRMSDRNFPTDDPMQVMVVAALKAMYELHAEVTCRSMDGKGLDDTPKPPAVDPLFTRKSALRKDEKIRLGRIRRDAH